MAVLCLSAAGLRGARNIASIRSASGAFRLISEGGANQEAAALLSLGVCAVYAHRARILEKRNLDAAGGFVRFALPKGSPAESVAPGLRYHLQWWFPNLLRRKSFLRWFPLSSSP